MAIYHFENILKDIFDEFTAKFVNKMHDLQCQYTVQNRKKRILVVIRIHKPDVENACLKSAMYVRCTSDIDFLRAYLAGICITLAVGCVSFLFIN